MTLIEFECRNQRFALPLDVVRRVVPSAAPAPLPGAPEIVVGILNVGGELVTVVDFFRRVGLPLSSISPLQRLLMIDLADFPVGFFVDDVYGVTERAADETFGMPDRLAGAEFVSAVLRLEDGLCIIVDPEKFLFAEERMQLGEALRKVGDEQP